MSEKLFEYMRASEGKIFAKLIDDELIFTTVITAPLNTDLSDWLEFDSEEQAKEYYEKPKI